jgi:hypothetical protein
MNEIIGSDINLTGFKNLSGFFLEYGIVKE